MSQRPPHPIAAAAALLALLVVGLGLPQFLVLCTPQRGDVHLTFAAEGGHCGDADPTAPGGPDGGERAVAADGHCEHTSLAVELAPNRRFELPRALLLHPPCGAAVPPALAPLPDADAGARPPSTGPPRPERRSEQLVCTILRQ